MPQEPALCAASHVSLDYALPNGRTFRAVDDVSLEVRADEVVALLGPSGCGKSTLLRVLAGLIRPTAGEALYHGTPLAGLNPGVAIVFQSFALYPWMTVAGNIACVLEAAGLPAREVRERAARAVSAVGLAGFEGAYPRELSGGMKQRVGIARAASLDPEILFMDEPFSQVDALTAESLRAEVLDLWADKEENPSSILMVSHDIKEVVYMADRIVVLGANPGRVRTIVENRLPRPRDYRAPEFLALVDRLHDVITGHEMPDVPRPAAVPPARQPFEPLPRATTSEITGLLEFLDARGGEHSLFQIATETGQEFGQLMAIVKAAEMLELVETPGQRVVLSAAGRRFLQADARGRQAVWGEELLKLRLFREVVSLVQGQPDQELDAMVVEEALVTQLPQENHETLFDTVVRWGRFGNLFTYDESSQRIATLRRG